MINFIISALKVIVMLGVLIGIHELGHFLVAKLCKVRVNEFAIGFGPTIWKKQGKETKYALRLIPLGGFVNMEGEEERSNKEGSFSNSSIPKRIAIVAAGALVNIIIALIIYFLVSSISGTHITTIIENFKSGYSAESSDLEVGDRILKINGKNVNISSDVNETLENADGNEITLLVERTNTNLEESNKEKIEIKITPTKQEYKTLGIYMSASEKSTKVLSLDENGAAKKYGIKTGDVITKINNEDVKNDETKLAQALNKNMTDNSNNDAIKVTIERVGESNSIDIDIIPEIKSSYYLGVFFKGADNNVNNNIYYGLIDTGKFFISMFDSLKQLFSGKVSVDQMMGPVGISEVIVQTNGFKEFISMFALISMSLGVMNLLPVPPLDGFKILLYIIEAIRKKPIKEETEMKLQLIGFALLIILSVYIAFNDILRIL